MSQIEACNFWWMRIFDGARSLADQRSFLVEPLGIVSHFCIISPDDRIVEMVMINRRAHALQVLHQLRVSVHFSFEFGMIHQSVLQLFVIKFLTVGMQFIWPRMNNRLRSVEIVVIISFFDKWWLLLIPWTLCIVKPTFIAIQVLIELSTVHGDVGIIPFWCRLDRWKPLVSGSTKWIMILSCIWHKILHVKSLVIVDLNEAFRISLGSWWLMQHRHSSARMRFKSGS